MKRIWFALAFLSVHALAVLALAQPTPGTPPDNLAQHRHVHRTPVVLPGDVGWQRLPQHDPAAPPDDLAQHRRAPAHPAAPHDALGQRLLIQSSTLLDTPPDERGQHILAKAALDVPPDDLGKYVLPRTALDTPPGDLSQHVRPQPDPNVPDDDHGQRALAQPDPNAPPDDLGQHIGNVIDAVRSGSAIAIAAALIMLLTSLFKAPWLGSVFRKIPKRWRIAIPIILSGIAGVLSSIVGGVPWQEAVLVGLFAGPTAVFAHEAVVEAILGHARTRTPHLAS